MKEELLKGLTEEQIAKIKACKNQEEVLKLAKEEGIELTDEQLEAVSGGCFTDSKPAVCPKCGGVNDYNMYLAPNGRGAGQRMCNKCGYIGDF